MKKTEVWQGVPGYHGLYMVSNSGNFKTLICRYGNKTDMKKTDDNGYYAVTLIKDKKPKKFRAHRLVAMAFIPNPESKPQVNHIDGNKQNNNVENLEWVTAQENTRHAYDTGLSKAWNKGVKMTHPHYNTGYRKRPDIQCYCGVVFKPMKETSTFCSKTCASKHREQSKKINNTLTPNAN